VIKPGVDAASMRLDGEHVSSGPGPSAVVVGATPMLGHEAREEPIERASARNCATL